MGISQIADLPEIFKIEESASDLEKIWSVVEGAVTQAVSEMVAMRDIEGTKLSQDLIHRLDKIAQFIREIEARAPLVVQAYRERLQTRIQEILGAIPVDEARLAMEVAVFSDRCNIY
jgi:uncharacterized protein (TIGR00255 family)